MAWLNPLSKLLELERSPRPSNKVDAPELASESAFTTQITAGVNNLEGIENNEMK